MIEGHGDDIYRYRCKVIDNFSSNIYMGADHSSLIAHLAGHLHGITSYPDPSGGTLADAIALAKGINRNNIILTNGCTECIYLTARIFRGRRTAILYPTFSEYNDACRINDLDITMISSLDSITDAYDLTWICNPNNPTGRAFPKERLLSIIHSFPTMTFVIDQAYEGYTSAPVITAQEATDAGNVILMNSLTKDYSIPGLRIGYAISSETLISQLKNVHMPWAVNSMALTAGEYLINHPADYVIPKVELHREALRIAEEFRRMGIEVEPTDCNFILCRLSKGSAGELKEYLVTQHGILIRDAANFHGLTPQNFRIAAQSREQNDRLIKAVRQWMCV